MNLTKWDILIITFLLIALILLINHYFTGRSWEPIVAALVSSTALLWKEVGELKGDMRGMKETLRRIESSLQHIEARIK